MSAGIHRQSFAEIGHGGPLTKEERVMLEGKLSRLLAWVGEKIPEHIELEGRMLPLHEVIWRLLNKDELTEKEGEIVLKLEEKLMKKFNQDYTNISVTDVTEDQAIKDYNEAIGLIRAIITLKDIAAREEKHHHSDREVAKKLKERRISDTASWMAYLKEIK